MTVTCLYRELSSKGEEFKENKTETERKKNRTKDYFVRGTVLGISDLHLKATSRLKKYLHTGPALGMRARDHFTVRLYPSVGRDDCWFSSDRLN